MSAPVMPSRLLCDPNPDRRLPYIPAILQDTEGLLARWQRSEDNPANYPDEKEMQS